MAKSKAGVKKKKPSHVRYMTENHLRRNKLSRVLRFNGPVFAEMWEKTYG
jgi:hypothetical protein